MNFAGVTNAFLLVYAALFPIVNPVGSAPIFLRLTQASPADRPALAGAVATNSFLLLLGSLLIGSHVLEFFGITLPVVRVAGGLVVASLGWKMLHTNDEPENQRAATEHASGAPVDAFYPLTMPLTVGPGSISVAITLGSQRPNSAFGLSNLVLLAGGALAGLAAMAATIFVCYRFAGSIVTALGRRGTDVMMRLSAFILVCIGIQIIWNGYVALMATQGRSG